MEGLERISKPLVAVLLAAAGSGATALVLSAPLLMQGPNTALLGVLTHVCFGGLCHQLPERSFMLLGLPVAACVRCLGLYAGVAVGAWATRIALGPAARFVRSRALPAALLPLVVDGAANTLGLWDSPAVLRLLTGLLAGAAFAPLAIEGLAALPRRLGDLRTSRPAPAPAASS